MQKGRFALPVVLAFRISLRVSEMEFAQSILQKIYIAAIFSKYQGCTYTDSCSISGLIIYQIDPATFLLSARLLCSVLVKASLAQIPGPQVRPVPAPISGLEEPQVSVHAAYWASEQAQRWILCIHLRLSRSKAEAAVCDPGPLWARGGNRSISHVG